jgi:hypothetical protein
VTRVFFILNILNIIQLDPHSGNAGGRRHTIAPEPHYATHHSVMAYDLDNISLAAQGSHVVQAKKRNSREGCSSLSY